MDDADKTTPTTNEKFIADVVENIQKDTECDCDLLQILNNNVVKMNPAETSVDDAVKAIEKLAKKRAEKVDKDKNNS